MLVEFDPNPATESEIETPTFTKAELIEAERILFAEDEARVEACRMPTCFRTPLFTPSQIEAKALALRSQRAAVQASAVAVVPSVAVPVEAVPQPVAKRPILSSGFRDAIQRLVDGDKYDEFRRQWDSLTEALEAGQLVAW